MTCWTRFVGITLLSLSGAWSAPVGEIAPHTYEIPGGIEPGRQPDGNTYILRGTKGLTIIDTGRHASHRLKIEAFAAQVHQPVVAIINTHWHLDHVSGNIGLRKAYPDLKVYSSAAINKALTGFLAKGANSSRKALASPDLDPMEREERATDLATVEAGDALKPDVVLDHTATVSIDGRELQIHVAKNAATAGDVWLFDANTKMLFAGDLVTFPAPFLDTACPKGWKEALDEIGKTPFQTLAPGHGPLLSRAQFRSYELAFGELLACSSSDGPAAVCAGNWIEAVNGIVEMTPKEKQFGKGMTAYYVTSVLRANGGHSQFCSSAN